MADAVTFQLRGGKEIVAAMADMRQGLQNKLLRSALRSSAERMRAVVVSLAPKRTLRLVRAIGVRTKKSAGTVHAQVTVNAGGARNDPDNAFYWRFLEKGWHDRAGRPHRIPFVEPAFDSEAQDASQSVLDVLADELRTLESRSIKR